MEGNSFSNNPYGDLHSVSQQFDQSYGKMFVQVDGYMRDDGTYVKPHLRTHPDGIDYSNLSYPGNTTDHVIDLHSNMHQHTGLTNDTEFTNVMQQQDPLAHIDSYRMPPFGRE